MASIAYGTATFPTRLCVILTDTATGGPISGVPFFCHAAVAVGATAAPGGQSLATMALDVPLGTLASDQSGYLSFDLSNLERRLDDLQQQQTVAANSAAAITLSHLWLHPYSPIAQTIDALAVENVVDDAIVVRLMVDSGSVYASDGKGFASMQAPGLTDWFLSPGSFAHLSAEIVGQDGCETLLPSNIAVQSFQFIQILPLTQTFALEAAAARNAYVPNNHNAILGQLKVPSSLAVQVSGAVSAASLELQAGIPAGTASVGLGMYVMYDASWLPVGHGLGQIVYSMPLAPAEQVDIAIIDWSRTSTDSRVENTGLTDTLQHDTNRDRTVGEVVDSTVKEWQRGGSIMGGASVTGGYGGMIGAAASLGGAYQTSSGDRSVSANTVQNLSDKFAQTSTSIRDLRSTVVVQSSQQETQNLQTRTVRNYNHSHAMTVLYYEVLRHYRTVVERGDVGPALLIPQSMPDFDAMAVFNYRRFLQPALLMPELAGGFDAGETLYALEQDPPPVATADQSTLAFNFFRIIFHCGTRTSQANVSVQIKPSNYDDSPTTVLVGTDGSSADLGENLRFVDAANNSVEIQAVPQGGTVTWSNIGFFAISVNLIADSTHDNETLRLDVNLVEVKGVDIYGSEHPLGSWSGNQGYAGTGVEIFPVVPATRPPPPPAPLSPLQQLPIDQRHLYVRLLVHLNSNKSYYYKQIWMAEEPNTRAARFQDLTVTIGAVTMPLLSVVENRVVDVLGAQLVMPMDPSYFASSAVSDGDRQLLSLPVVSHARTEQLISLPTRGVFAEAKLGHCNASEVIDNTRFWDWQTSPIPDSAPQITGIAPVTPQAAPNLTPTTLPASVLSIQQPAPAPDPIGLRAALDVLKTPGIFNNMSGIQQLQGLLTTLTNAAVQAQGLSKQTAAPAGGQGASATTTPAVPPTSAPTASSGTGTGGTASGTAASTSPTTDTGGAEIPATVTPQPAATPSPAPTPTPAPAIPAPATPAKAVGTQTAQIYFNFTDSVAYNNITIWGTEEGLPPVAASADPTITAEPATLGVAILKAGMFQGPRTFPATLPTGNSFTQLFLQITGSAFTENMSGIFSVSQSQSFPRPSNGNWVFDVSVVKLNKSITIPVDADGAPVDTVTAISASGSISVAQIISFTLSGTRSDAPRTQTYSVDYLPDTGGIATLKIVPV